MKKVWVFLVLMAMAASTFAVYGQSGSIFIEGTAENTQQLAFFRDNFRAEAVSLGHTVVNSKNAAGYTFKFAVNPNVIRYSNGTVGPVPLDDKQYIILINLIRNVDNYELISLSYLFTSLDEMYGVTQHLFFMAAANIPAPVERSPVRESTPLVLQDSIVRPPPIFPEENAVMEPLADEKSAWMSQWFYLRASLDFTVDMLKPVGGSRLRGGYFPGATLGAEVMFLDFMSAEVNLLLSLGDPRRDLLANYALAASAELKFPFVFKNFLLEPYGAFLFPFIYPEIYSRHPGAAAGAGIQTGIKAGSKGALFLDVNFMYYFNEAILKNPANAMYNRFAARIGIGYKHGFADRKKGD